VYQCEAYIDKVFCNIDQIKTAFDDIHIIVSYDKCDDHTLLKLIHYKKTYSKYEICINTHPRSPVRTENISNARNRILDKIRGLLNTPEYDEQEWTHFIMMDFDDVCSDPIALPVLQQYLGVEWIDKWDSISFNREFYYDIWALSFEPFIYSCWGFCDPLIVVYIIREEISRRLANLPKDQLFECDSAFNGFAIYRCSKFIGCHYDWHLPKHFISEAQMNHNIGALGFRQPKTPFHEISEEPDCEHRHFHMQAKHEFGARIFISPLPLFPNRVLSHG
jgi:hypothetical protein